MIKFVLNNVGFFYSFFFIDSLCFLKSFIAFLFKQKRSKETDVSHIKYAINLVSQILFSELSDRNCQISTLIQV